ncbi:MAG TPA: MBL fold metallo-hydrolase [Terriglobia bacterium]|nr:MBL fold metallo-hydrolase [Terriglobia bacterium]
MESSRLVRLMATVVLAASSGRCLFSQTVKSQKAAAPTAAIVLGVGSPNVDAERSGTSIGIVATGTLYLFDAGPGVERRIAEAHPKLEALKVQRFGSVFISHLHRDHTAGLAALIYYHNVDGPFVVGGDVLNIYGPGAEKGSKFGITDVVNHLRAALADPGLAPGIEPGSPYMMEGPPVRSIEIKPGLVYKDSAVTVTAFEVSHKTPISFGFRIQTADRVIVLSGDTRPSDAVVQACNGCDLLFHEVFGERFGPNGPIGPAQGHTSAEELGDVARRARPKHLVIYHDVQLDHDVGTQIIRKAYTGEVAFARDLDIY